MGVGSLPQLVLLQMMSSNGRGEVLSNMTVGTLHFSKSKTLVSGKHATHSEFLDISYEVPTVVSVSICTLNLHSTVLFGVWGSKFYLAQAGL